MTVGDKRNRTNELEALEELAAFPLVDALYGRRSRRFALGSELPDGPLAHRSRPSRCRSRSWSGCWS